MPQDIVETFARNLIDQIVLEASDETKTQTEKEVSQTHTQENNMYVGYSKEEETEALERIVHDLRDVQIGDSHFIYSPPMLSSDRQTRRLTCLVDNAPIDDSGAIVEMSGIQGQGDVESIAHDAEPGESKAMASANSSYRREREQYGSNDATKVSINVLHRMIEELETVIEDPNDPNDPNDTNDTNGVSESDKKSKEEIAIWEEREEELIRVIEGNDGSHEHTTEESGSIRQYTDEYREELQCLTLRSDASSSKNLSFDEVYIEKNPSDCPARPRSPTNVIDGSQVLTVETKETEKKETKLEGNKKMKKKEGKKESLGRRLKKFFLRSSKREKN